MTGSRERVAPATQEEASRAPPVDRASETAASESAAHAMAPSDDGKSARDAVPRGRPLSEDLAEVRWMLEELRVNQFAQALGTRGQVSSKRIRRALAGV